MFWIITAADAGLESRVGRGNLPPTHRSRMRATKEKAALTAELAQDGIYTHEWRTLDANDHVYFSGRCQNPTQFDRVKALGPLDFAQGDAGATKMEFRQIGGTKWHEL